ncbi:MAG TPA: hypothetical protein VFA65_24170 [Bryobacteraceae bacterium]|nr:hypothetical protein [Bryobacteraceae bacterium]
MIRDGFHAALRRELDEKTEPLKRLLCSGIALSFDDYKNRVGYLQAITDVIAICEQVESKLYDNQG